MSSLNPTTGANILKHVYRAGLEHSCFETQPILSMGEMDNEWTGDTYSFTIRGSNVVGISGNMQTAQANKGAGTYGRFSVSRRKMYCLASIDGEMIDATENDEGAQVKAVTETTDSALERYALLEAAGFFRNGGGNLGRISTGSTIASTAITLANTDDHVNFQKGDWITTATTDGTSGAIKTGRVQLTSVGRTGSNKGVLTTTGTNWSTGIPTVATSDYLFVEGTFGVAAYGLDAWIPSDRSILGTAFNGVTRSDDELKYAGFYFSGSGGQETETLIDALAEGQGLGVKAEWMVMHTSRFSRIEKATQVRTYLNMSDATAKLGFQGLAFNAPGGKVVKVIGSPFCPMAYAWGLDPSTWVTKSQGGNPKFLVKGNGGLLVEQNDDALELRIGGRRNRFCVDPGKNMVVAW